MQRQKDQNDEDEESKKKPRNQQDEEAETEYVKRMLKVYDDKNYEKQEITQSFKEFKAKVNRHSVTLVLQCVIKLFDKIIKLCIEATKKCSQKKQKIHSLDIRRIYVTCSKVYISDMILYISMQAPEEDLFYQNSRCEQWDTMRSFSC